MQNYPRPKRYVQTFEYKVKGLFYIPNEGAIGIRNVLNGSKIILIYPNIAPELTPRFPTTSFVH